MSITVYMLPVGQGAMNLITEYDGTKLVNLVLIDCGDLNIWDKVPYNKWASSKAKKFVQDKMAERFITSDGKVCLDFLLITHRHSDHICFSRELFDIDNIAVVPSDNKILRFYENDEYTDVYTLLTGKQTILCERQIHLEAEYNIRVLEYSFIIEYEDCKSFFSARCVWHQFYEVDITCISGKERMFIHAECIENNIIHVTVNNSQSGYYLEIDQPYEDDYALMLDVFFTVFYHDCQWFSSHEAIEKYFNLLEHSTYKTYNDVLADLEKIKRRLKKPIAMSFIGGTINKAENTVSFIREMTETYIEDFNPEIDIFHFLSPITNMGLQIIQYASIEQMCDFFGVEHKYIDSLNNATSAVSLLHDKDNEKAFKVLFTGDATQHTFGMISKRNSALELLRHAVWTAPHHGSINTLYAIDDIVPFDRILAVADVKSIVISAGYGNIHGHPHGSFIKKFQDYFAMKHAQTSQEKYICFNRYDTRESSWVCQPTKLPIYTTLTKDSFVAHIFENLPNSIEKFKYTFEVFSEVTVPYELPQDDSVNPPAGSPRPLDDDAVSENGKTKIADADISLKKLFIIR